MAFVTAPTAGVPDFNYEYHILNVDTKNQPSANAFTCFLNRPMKNVVQASLLAAHIHTPTTTSLCYVSVDELDTNFHERASNVYDGQPELSILRGSFGSIISSNTVPLLYKNEYPISAQYIDPIKSIDRLSIKLYDQSAVLITPIPGNANFLIFQFMCKKGNVSGF